MRTVTLTLQTASIDPALAYTRISDFARYPDFTPTVLGVEVQPTDPDGSVISSWLVAFRKGQLRWTERDVLDPTNRRIEFAQLTGDFASFTGSWQVDDDPSTPGSVVRFEASFDLGIPTLAAILDPVAEATLQDNIELIVTGLLGPVTELKPVGALP